MGTVKKTVNANAPGIGGASLPRLLNIALMNDGRFVKSKSGNYKVVKRKIKRAYKGRKKYQIQYSGVKRPKAPFMWYMLEKRAEIKANNPELKPTEIAVEIGKLWRSLEEEEKTPYLMKAEDDKLRYAREMKANGSSTSSSAAIHSMTTSIDATESVEDEDEVEPPPRRSTRPRR
eukprot:SAG31_NODE_234_length_19701_cov_16.835068_2_plen_175_part_00